MADSNFYPRAACVGTPHRWFLAQDQPAPPVHPEVVGETPCARGRCPRDRSAALMPLQRGAIRAGPHALRRPHGEAASLPRPGRACGAAREAQLFRRPPLVILPPTSGCTACPAGSAATRCLPSPNHASARRRSQSPQRVVNPKLIPTMPPARPREQGYSSKFVGPLLRLFLALGFASRRLPQNIGRDAPPERGLQAA